MQYGNSLAYFVSGLCFAQFKSYYVVWKHNNKMYVLMIFSGLNRTMQYGNSSVSIKQEIDIKFKSYYVVWKQDRRGGRIMFYSGLNRTMQYGNIVDGRTVGKCYARFKSYYVVWKLYPYVSLVYIWPCLNRTMQYGNLC